MQTLNHACISSWDEVNVGTINAEASRQLESAEWPRCLASLSELLANRNAAETDSTAPNNEALIPAMRYLQALRRQYPQAPPTMITPEPAGGIIIERRITSAEGQDVIVELTFNNDSTIDSTVYRNGRVVLMEQFK